ncbi:ABC transporter permease [Methylobacterium gnaphalii]|uniref:Transport permease protein n=1 Tax=Methylobacterium gnaphalii TaxID=1010610 RepID=A0A512JRS1_9HYPH|nr:ABC transporter permease [Methylobacterium gnaphalii]GEP12664.1 transport permease protein [Methylobacterium gnaphalii]GJD71371.1 Polysialic acid transport protein KpsM [Methylobacterium gnaphalii]GLS51386.1 transport permease protein [Methylobacterium gnaphalii]
MPEIARPERRVRQVTKIDRTDIYLRVLHALLLRDMRTRFLGSYWGYAIQVMWPVTHLLMLSALLILRGGSPGFGESTFVFIASGAVPALAFQYIAREIMKGINQNKPLVYYPQVRTLDVMFSRIIVEVASSFMGVIVIMLLIVLWGDNPMPVAPVTAISGYICAIMLGVGVGTINAAVIQFFPGWMTGFIIISIGTYATSGVYMMPHEMPETVYHTLKWNPIVQLVEWVRLGYDPNLPITVDYVYMFFWVFGTITIGLFLEKNVSRKSL